MMPAWIKFRFSQDILVIIASIATIIISITCAVMVSSKSRQMEMIAQRHIMQASFYWCLPCEVLANRSTPNVLEKLHKTLVGEALHCCAFNKEQATLLLELMSSTAVQEVSKTSDADNFALSEASAHQHLILPRFFGLVELTFADNNVNLEFDVTKPDPLIDHARNITVTQSAMTVQLPGLYYIYSSIFFKPNNSQPCRELPKQIWGHNILLSRRGGPTDEVIFNTTYKCCDTCVQHKKTSYTGGLIGLKENDRLHVQVSSVGPVSFSKESSYFGLFMLE